MLRLLGESEVLVGLGVGGAHIDRDRLVDEDVHELVLREVILRLIWAA